MDDMFYVIISVILITATFEFLLLRKRELARYEVKDTLANVAIGLGMMAEKIAFSALLYFPYSFFYKFRIFDLPKSGVVFLLLIFAEDYTYYWFHRVSHESRFFWCSHETHHSSERLNISTSIRQTWTGYATSWMFWMPLVIIGFPPEWVLLAQGINLLYQVFTHTEAVSTLGFIEKFMNTPSHHRVHHARNLAYLDKNYAGIFIIWDKLHGTFAKEVAVPRYGTSDKIKTFNPFRICFHMWVKLARDLRDAPGIINKLKVAFYPPGFRFDGTDKTIRQLQASRRLKVPISSV